MSMPLVSSRKGFYVSTPLVGSTLFLIAFLLSVVAVIIALAALVASEWLARRSGNRQGAPA